MLATNHAKAADFSHKLHLKLVPNCTDSHSAVTASTKVEDNNLPTAAACNRCHPDGRTIPPPEPTKLARFSHAQHLKLGNASKIIAAAIDKHIYLSATPPTAIRQHLEANQNTCVACHRGLEESDTVTHADLPRMAGCLVCHSKIDPPDSCATCHTKDMNLKPASHVEASSPNTVPASSTSTKQPAQRVMDDALPVWHATNPDFSYSN